MIDIKAIRERADKATKGPWGSIGGYVTNRDPDGSSFSRSIEHLDELGQPHNTAPFQAVKFAMYDDAAFIAAARTDIPALCDEVERLREQVKELEQTLQDNFEIMEGPEL